MVKPWNDPDSPNWIKTRWDWRKWLLENTDGKEWIELNDSVDMVIDYGM